MISIYDTTSVSTAKMTDLPVVSVCSLSVSGSEFFATGLPAGVTAGRSVLSGLPVGVRDERPNVAPEAGAAAEAQAYAFAATGAGSSQKQMNQHHTMWAFRGPEPWRDPA